MALTAVPRGPRNADKAAVVQLSAQVQPGIVERIDAYAAANQISRAAAIRQLLLVGLKSAERHASK